MLFADVPDDPAERQGQDDDDEEVAAGDPDVATSPPRLNAVVAHFSYCSPRARMSIRTSAKGTSTFGSRMLLKNRVLTA